MKELTKDFVEKQYYSARISKDERKANHYRAVGMSMLKQKMVLKEFQTIDAKIEKFLKDEEERKKKEAKP